VPTWQHVLRHWQWRHTFLSRATLDDAAKKVTRIKKIHRWFIFKNYFKFRLFLSKLPAI
jgi:hypothetical protein